MLTARPPETLAICFRMFATCSPGAFAACLQVDEADREECLAMMPVAFFLPAVLSGLIAIPVHGALCKFH